MRTLQYLTFVFHPYDDEIFTTPDTSLALSLSIHPLPLG
jgi:hypothetical protein